MQYCETRELNLFAMKQNKRIPTSTFTQLNPQQMFALIGGDNSSSASGALPPVSAPDDADPLSISNVLKTKHDTAKNSVGNIR
jgi:hypothetical protein